MKSARMMGAGKVKSILNTAMDTVLRSTRRKALRAWTDESLSKALDWAGFDVELFGDMEGGPYDRLESGDLVVLARRR